METTNILMRTTEDTSLSHDGAGIVPKGTEIIIKGVADGVAVGYFPHDECESLIRIDESLLETV